jgi:hypothetical protein
MKGAESVQSLSAFFSSPHVLLPFVQAFEKAGLASALPNARGEVEVRMLHLILPVVLEEKWPYL